MKPSRYNLIFEHNGKKLAFNSSTCALAEVKDDFLKILNNTSKDDIGNVNKELLEDMKRGNYVVEDDFDELEYLKFVSYRGKFAAKGLGLV